MPNLEDKVANFSFLTGLETVRVSLSKVRVSEGNRIFQ